MYNIEWISVEDRFPEPYDWVLVCNSPKGTNEPRSINIWRWSGEEWDSINQGHADSPTFSDIIHTLFYDEITHWMPLPNPPKE